MGKGDKKSRKGKIIMGSYGKKRPRDPWKHKTTVKSTEEKFK
ncbi:30S ribosomal protein THX [Sphingobacterium sp.]|nr:30S ribosomal protein THX [Sphingobacterium sp.]